MATKPTNVLEVTPVVLERTIRDVIESSLPTTYERFREEYDTDRPFMHLRDLKIAWHHYIDHEVALTIGNVTCDTTCLEPNENFTFKITVRNGVIPLKNVRYFVEIAEPACGLLLAPPYTGLPATWHAFDPHTGTVLPAETKIRAMKLADVLPNMDFGYLKPNELVTFELHGVSQPVKTVTTTQIFVRIEAELDWLAMFPKRVNDPVFTNLTVVP